jgi:hypothetical protein
MMNIADAEDALLDGMMTVQDFMRDFMEKWEEPIKMMQAAQAKQDIILLWEQIPAEVKAQAQAKDPQKFARAEAQIKQFISGKEKKNGNN